MNVDEFYNVDNQNFTQKLFHILLILTPVHFYVFASCKYLLNRIFVRKCINIEGHESNAS